MVGGGVWVSRSRGCCRRGRCGLCGLCVRDARLDSGRPDPSTIDTLHPTTPTTPTTSSTPHSHESRHQYMFG